MHNFSSKFYIGFAKTW